MKLLLFIGSILSGVIGGLILMNAESAIHEIEAFMLFLISVVQFVGVAVIEAIDRVRNELMEEEDEEDT